MRTFVHILAFKNLMFWKVTFSPSFQAVLKNIGSLIVFGSFAVGAFFFSHFVTGFLLEDVKIGLFLFHRFVSMLLFVFFVSINLGNMVVSFSTLYRSPEVQFLLTTPVSFLNIFIIKFLDNFFYSSGTLFLAGFSVLLGYGVYFGMPWYFYPFIMFGVLIPFMFFAACIAVLVLLFLMRLAERINFKRLIWILVLFYVAQVYLYFRITSPVDLAQEVMKYYPYVNNYFASLDPPVTKYFPNYWVGEILYFFLAENSKAVFGYFLLLLLSGAAAFIAVILGGERLFYPTWLTSLSLRIGTEKKGEVKSGVLKFESRSVLEPHTEVIVKKEFWQFFREPSQWIHLAVMAMLVAVFMMSVSSADFRLTDPGLRTVVYLVVFVFNAFLVTSIALRFSFPLMSLEGKAFWSMRSSPVPIAKAYWIKFFTVAAPLTLIAILLAIFSNYPYQTRPILMTIATPNMVFVAISLVSLNIAMGTVFVNYAEKNPIRIASSQGATLTFLISLVYLIFLVVAYFFPLYTYFAATAITHNASRAVMYVPLGMIAVMSVVIILLSHILGVKSLKRDI